MAFVFSPSVAPWAALLGVGLIAWSIADERMSRRPRFRVEVEVVGTVVFLRVINHLHDAEFAVKVEAVNGAEGDPVNTGWYVPWRTPSPGTARRFVAPGRSQQATLATGDGLGNMSEGGSRRGVFAFRIADETGVRLPDRELELDLGKGPTDVLYQKQLQVKLLVTATGFAHVVTPTLSLGFSPIHDRDTKNLRITYKVTYPS